MSHLCLLAAAALGPPAHAQPKSESPETGKNVVNVRIGGASTDENGRPVICLEARVVSRLSVEGCGTGTGFLHNDDGSEMAHFRARWALLSRSDARGTVRAQLGAGFAELQLGGDEPGFVFGEPTGPDPSSIAGPELSMSVQGLKPLGKGFELVANFTLGAAWFQYAPVLVVPQDRAQLFVSFEVGVGW